MCDGVNEVKAACPCTAHVLLAGWRVCGAAVETLVVF